MIGEEPLVTIVVGVPAGNCKNNVDVAVVRGWIVAVGG
jgi:hypothetical protein